jgi:hypothetical protein
MILVIGLAMLIEELTFIPKGAGFLLIGFFIALTAFLVRISMRD